MCTIGWTCDPDFSSNDAHKLYRFAAKFAEKCVVPTLQVSCDLCTLEWQKRDFFQFSTFIDNESRIEKNKNFAPTLGLSSPRSTDWTMTPSEFCRSVNCVNEDDKGSFTDVYNLK